MTGTPADRLMVTRPAAKPLRVLYADPERDQELRLLRFREAHPDVIVGDGEFGTWEARIPEPNGETTIVRYLLCELLDKLDSIYAAASGEPSGQGV